ncbi:hypothetical protein WJX75_000511 [Coccomyxa subellipsoidea]|uniref:Arf-GAP domain-containing protein n=1 Tax=Coccomyxa subellipsoidea TaxID=248742 RepID=A0ABR2YIP2_9CHLO
MGNRRANLFWEARLSSGFRRPSEGDMVGLKRFIEEKYRNQAYAARGYSQPPSIENAANHPFLKELEAKEAGGSARPEEAGRTAAAQPSAAPKPSAVAAKPLQPPASTAKPAPVAAPQPAQLFDLLSLHDAPAVSTATPAPAASHDEGWAAFLDASPAPASAAPPAAEAASPTDDHWDAFQGSTSPAAPSAASPADDPFAPKPQASAASRQEPPSSPGDPFAESQGAQQPPPKEPVAAAPAPKKSAADILKMFDAPMQGQPQPGLGGGFPQHGGGMGVPGMMPQHYRGMQGMGGTFQQQQFYPQQAAGGVQGLQPMPILGSTVGLQPGFMSGAALPYGGSAFHQPQMPQLPPSQAPKFASGPSINGSFS